MKAQTRIKAACKTMYDAYVDYSRKVLNIPVIPNIPKVEWRAGNPKDGNAGWIVDGRLYPGTAEQVVSHFEERTVYWLEKTRRKSEPSVNNGHHAQDLPDAPEIPLAPDEIMPGGDQ